MTEKLLEEMSPEEFEQLMDDFITREQTEVSISTFFKALALIDRERQAAASTSRRKSFGSSKASAG